MKQHKMSMDPGPDSEDEDYESTPVLVPVSPEEAGSSSAGTVSSSGFGGISSNNPSSSLAPSSSGGGGAFGEQRTSLSARLREKRLALAAEDLDAERSSDAVGNGVSGTGATKSRTK
jgi:hypothetical protein